MPVAGPSMLRDDQVKPTTGKQVVHQPSPPFQLGKTEPEAISDESTIGTCATWDSRGARNCTSAALENCNVSERLSGPVDQQADDKAITNNFRSNNTKARKVWNQIKSCTFQQNKPEYSACRNIPEASSDVRFHCDEFLSLKQEVVYDGVLNATADGCLNYVENRSSLYNLKKWNVRRIKGCSQNIKTNGRNGDDTCQKDEIISQVEYIGHEVQETEELQELSGTPSKKERQRRWTTIKEGYSTSPPHHSTTRSTKDPVSIIRSDYEVPMKRDAKNHNLKLSTLRDDVLLIYGIDITQEQR